MWGKSAGKLWVGRHLTTEEEAQEQVCTCVLCARLTGEVKKHHDQFAGGERTKLAPGKGTEAKPGVPPLNILLYKTQISLLLKAF